MEQKELNTIFHTWFYGHPANKLDNLRNTILMGMRWSKHQLTDRLLGRTNVKIAEIELICLKCNKNIADEFPKIAALLATNEVDK